MTVQSFNARLREALGANEMAPRTNGDPLIAAASIAALRTSVKNISTD